MPSAKAPPLKRSAKRVPAKRAAPPVKALAEAAWVEADSALAEALVEFGRAYDAKSEVKRAEAMELLSLALARASRRRGLTRIGKQGAIEDFDPKLHELESRAKTAPKRVRVVVQGVARGRQVLVKARVATARAKRA